MVKYESVDMMVLGADGLHVQEMTWLLCKRDPG